MTITRSDLKVFKPEILGNQPFAGGQRTSNEVINGKLNDVFTAISDIDHARSAFDIVKLYPSVATNDTSKLQDGYVFLSDQPADPLVSTFIVEAVNFDDESTLDDMQEMMIKPTTRFHGSALAIEEITADKIQLNNTVATIVPQISKNEGNFGRNGYLFEPGVNASGVGGYYQRNKSFTAGSTGNVKFFVIDVPDYFEDNPTAYVKYNAFGEDWLTLGLATPNLKEEYGIEFKDGALHCELVHPLQANNIFTFYYRSSEDYRKHSYATTPTLTLAGNESIVRETYRVKKAGESEVYTDDGSGLFVDNQGNVFAQLDYDTGAITPSEAVDLTSTIQDDLGCSIFISNVENQSYPEVITFVVESTNRLILGSLYLKVTLANDTVFSVSANEAGTLLHDNFEAGSQIELNGYVTINVVDGITIKKIDYDIEEQTQSLAKTDWYGFDVTQMPGYGYADIFHVNNVVAIQNKELTTEETLIDEQVISILADADYVDIVDNDGNSLYTVTDDNYSYDKVTGNLTINAGVSGFTGPFIITAVQSERNLVVAKDKTSLTLLYNVKRTYPVGSTISSVYVLGDMQAIATDARTIGSWRNIYVDRLGYVYNGTTQTNGSSNFNTLQYPIELVNTGAINELWAIVFGQDGSFTVIGSGVGTVAAGDILSDLIVINPLTLTPFMTIRKEAFGAGLQPGEAFLFETIAASKPVMLARSVSPGHSDVQNDGTTLAFFGNQD